MGARQTKQPADSIETELERMQRETDAIIEMSAKLIKQMEELMECGRQLRAAQAALIEQRNKNKKALEKG
jgi:hypothetical protein